LAGTDLEAAAFTAARGLLAGVLLWGFAGFFEEAFVTRDLP
jgi:hypothetical protein